MTGVLHVCRSCQGCEAVRRVAGATASTELFEAITAMVRHIPDPTAFGVAAQECLGPCGAGVRIALTGTGRWGWLFQGLQPGADLEALASFLLSWCATPDGLPDKPQRPARLLRKTAGRLPPSGSNARSACSFAADKGGNHVKEHRAR